MLIRMFLSLCLGLAPIAAWAGEFTANRPVRIVVPVSPGGSADVMARIMAQALTPVWGQQVVVESRTGAGHTILFGTIAIHAAYGMYHRLGYDPVRDLAPVVLLLEVPFVIVAHPA